MTTEPQTTDPDAVDAIIEDWRRERPELDARTIGVFGRLHRLVARLRAVEVAN